MKEHSDLNNILKKFGNRIRLPNQSSQDSDGSQPKSSSLSDLFKAAKNQATQHLAPPLNPASSPHSVSPVGKFISSKRNEILANSTRFRQYPNNIRKHKLLSQKNQDKDVHLQTGESKSLLPSSLNKITAKSSNSRLGSVIDESIEVKPSIVQGFQNIKAKKSKATTINHSNETNLTKSSSIEKAPFREYDSDKLSTLSSRINAPESVCCYSDHSYYKDHSIAPMNLIQATEKIMYSTTQLEKLITTVKQFH